MNRLRPRLKGRRHRAQAQAALADRDYLLAREQLDACVQVWPRSAELRFLLARTCRQAADLTGWRNHLDEAKRLGWPADAIALEEQLAGAQEGRLASVERQLLGRLESGGDDEVLVVEALARGYLQNYRLKDVVRLADLWRGHHPDDWRPRYYRGQAFGLHQALDVAQGEYEAALELKPNQPEVQLALAGLLAARMRAAEAIEHYQAYLSRRPRDRMALFGLAYCQRLQGEGDAAHQTLAELGPDETFPAAVLLRGQLALDRQRPEEALVWLRRAEAVAPHEVEITATLARCLRQLGQVDEAAQYDRQSRDLDRQHKELTRLTDQIAARPEQVAPRHQAGVLCLALGRSQEAARWFESALQLDPDHEPSRKGLADCQARNHPP